jgi:hypothetical protein
METYTCADCDFIGDPESDSDFEHCSSIKETRLCLKCREDCEYCEKHYEYCFDEEDIKSINECGMCKECADEWLGEPESDDPDFWDSYDPD